jgi:hypothetical protein
MTTTKNNTTPIQKKFTKESIKTPRKYRPKFNGVSISKESDLLKIGFSHQTLTLMRRADGIKKIQYCQAILLVTRTLHQ